MDSSAAMVDASAEHLSASRLFEEAMRKYEVCERLEERLAQLAVASGTDERQDVERRKTVALAEAAEALKRLNRQDVRRELEAFVNLDGEGALRGTFKRDGPLLQSNSPDFWVSCFADLFYRGDCKERYLPTSCPEAFLYGYF